MERISALMDGDLDGQEAQTAVQRLLSEPDARSGWAQYHLISDALRDQYLLTGDIAERVSARLAEEPTVLAPQARRVLRPQVRKRGLSMMAAAAAIVAVGWFAWSTGAFLPDVTPLNLAGTVQSGGATGAAQLVSVDGNVRSYLLAHQEYSPTTQIQGVAPYVRTVAEAPADGAR